jgi:hypothetical protein
MIAAKLLCELITNPFGNEDKARELLSEIEGRDLSAAELERGQFSFQTAFYFVALLAIEASIADPSVRTAFLHQLHDRIRAFYARAASRVSFPGLIVSPAERASIEAALGRRLGGPDQDDGAASPVRTTALELFDLIGLRRLFEYRAATSNANGGDQFHMLAQQLLFHCSGRGHHTVVVATIADLLLANYNIASEIVTAGLAVIGTREIESRRRPQPLLLAAGMPDLTDKRPTKEYSAGPYLLLLFEDVAPIGRTIGLRFKHVLALCDRQDRRPVCFVTLENSTSIANVLCVFEQSGSHSNYGSLHGHNPVQEFMGKAVILLGDRFELGKIEEQPLPVPPRRRPRWMLFAPAAAHDAQAAPQAPEQAA